MGDRGVIFKVRSSELETGLSSSDDPVVAKVDTAASGQREVRAFDALKERCALDTDTLFVRPLSSVALGFPSTPSSWSS